MLKEKSTVIVLGLTTGQEIIGMLESETDTHYRIKHAKQMAQTHNGVGLAQLSFLADEESVISIGKSQVVYRPEKVNAEFSDSYEKSLSPIAQPSSGIITK